MNVIPLAAESLGVRSAAYFVETRDVKVLIDPGVSLAPIRFRLPPHPIEIRAMNECWKRIKDYATRADILIITHYHFDRVKQLIKGFRTLPRRVEFADAREFEFGRTLIRFSPAMPHGPDAKVGWVVQVSVREGASCFLHTSDIQGASRPEHLAFIRAENPDTLYLDGPLTYLTNAEFSAETLRASLRNICQLIEATRIKTLIIDHHLLRDQHWKSKIETVFASAQKAVKKVVTAAGFLGQEDETLEARRQQLYAFDPDMPQEPMQRNPNFHLSKKLIK
jgi:predicted metallo-beta-lactamase superfamily hydrolase